jgi:hypothetical protein
MAVMNQQQGVAPNAAKLNLLQMIRQACGELGLLAPSLIIGNSDQQVIQLYALACREARDTYQEGTGIGGWQALRQRYRFNVQSTGIIEALVTLGSNTVTFPAVPATPPQVGWVISNGGGSNASYFPQDTSVTAVISPTQVTVSENATATADTSFAFGLSAYPFPTDVDHLIPSTFWDRGQRWQIEGPLSPQDWQALKQGIIASGPRRRYRVMDGQFFLDPVPYDTNSIEYEYYSYNWAQSVTGTTQSGFLADTDIYLLDDDIMILGVIWRFRMAKGLEYSQQYNAWMEAMDRYKARQASSKSLPLNATVYSYPQFIGVANIPDTGFGVA